VFGLTTAASQDILNRESFNGQVQDKRLNASGFETSEEARDLLENWKTDYNEPRPHGSLGELPPAQYVANLMK
jgi:putative transposase